MEYGSILEKKDVLLILKTWMNLEEFMLSEINQEQKNKYCMSLRYIECEKKNDLIEVKLEREFIRSWRQIKLDRDQSKNKRTITKKYTLKHSHYG